MQLSAYKLDGYTKFMVEAATAYQKVLSVIAQIFDLLLTICL